MLYLNFSHAYRLKNWSQVCVFLEIAAIWHILIDGFMCEKVLLCCVFPPGAIHCSISSDGTGDSESGVTSLDHERMLLYAPRFLDRTLVLCGPDPSE